MILEPNIQTVHKNTSFMGKVKDHLKRYWLRYLILLIVLIVIGWYRKELIKFFIGENKHKKSNNKENYKNVRREVLDHDKLDQKDNDNKESSFLDENVRGKF